MRSGNAMSADRKTSNGAPFSICVASAAEEAKDASTRSPVWRS
jgi:hypothetical protein